MLDHHYRRRDLIAGTDEVAEKDANDAFFIGLAGHLLLVLTLLVWSWAHV